MRGIGLLKKLKSIFFSKESKKRFSQLSDIHSSLFDQLRLSQEKNSRLLSILESMSEGVMVIDAGQKILMVNSVLASELNIRREELPGRRFWEVLRDLELNDMIKKALNERVSIRKEHTPVLSDLIFQIQVSPVFAKSEFLGVVTVFHDVTKLKQLEKQGIEFVANVSHELKTPLTSILGFVETLKSGAIDDAENRGKFLQIIEEHSQKLHYLIEDLLLLSKIEAGAESLRKETFDVEKMILRVLGLFDNAIQEKKIRASVNIQPRPFLVSADAKLLEQAFSNLIDNAVKYNRGQGEIEVRVFRDVSEARIVVRDTGIGIPEQDLPRIFQRFYRVDRSRARESGGTGLGLSIAKHIVERHGGQLRAESIALKGSTFTIILP